VIDNTSLWPLFLLFLLLLLLLILLIGLLFQQYSLDLQYRIDEEEAQKKAAEDPANFRKAWLADRTFMHNYLNRNLRQNRMIFWLAAFMVIFGFATILLGAAINFWPAFSEYSTENGVLSVSDWIIIAGLITEFIAATVLFIYKATIQQSSSYFKELTQLNTVGLAAQMVNSIGVGTSSAEVQEARNAPPTDSIPIESEEPSAQIEYSSFKREALRDVAIALLLGAGSRTSSEDDA